MAVAELRCIGPRANVSLNELHRSMIKNHMSAGTEMRCRLFERRTVRSVCLGLLILSAGCSDQIPTYPAGGKVTFPDGSPLPAGFISFRSMDHPQHFAARGTIQSDGTFQLMTFAPGDGAVLGKHQAVITTPSPPDRPGFEMPRTPQIEAKFANFDTSGLEFEVSNDPAKNRFEIVVTPSR